MSATTSLVSSRPEGVGTGVEAGGRAERGLGFWSGWEKGWAKEVPYEQSPQSAAACAAAKRHRWGSKERRNYARKQQRGAHSRAAHSRPPTEAQGCPSKDCLPFCHRETGRALVFALLRLYPSNYCLLSGQGGSAERAKAALRQQIGHFSSSQKQPVPLEAIRETKDTFFKPEERQEPPSPAARAEPHSIMNTLSKPPGREEM